MANFTRDSNPFNNNRPRLTASERIKNKRDACIYQSEKSRFQIDIYKIIGNVPPSIGSK